MTTSEKLRAIGRDMIAPLHAGTVSKSHASDLPSRLAGKYLILYLKREAEQRGIKDLHISYDPNNFSYLEAQRGQEDKQIATGYNLTQVKEILHLGIDLGVELADIATFGEASPNLKGLLARIKPEYVDLVLPILRELPAEIKRQIPLRGFGAPTSAKSSLEIEATNPSRLVYRFHDYGSGRR